MKMREIGKENEKEKKNARIHVFSPPSLPP
jgi:hypothetical protein